MFKSVAPPEYSIFTDPHLKKRGLLDKILKLKDGEVVKMGEHWYDVRDSAREAGLNLEDYPSSPICHKAVAFPILDNKGEIKNYVFMHEDVTKRKLTEKKLLESEERFRSLVETTSDWIWEVDANSVFTYISPKIRDILGYEPEEIIGKTPFDLMPLDEAKRVKNIFQTILESDKSFITLENTNLHKNGSLKILETSGVPISDEKGDLLGYRGINRDITNRKKAEQKLKESEERWRSIKKLKESEERWRSITKYTPDNIMELDLDGNILFINRTVPDLTVDEVIGKSIYQFVPEKFRGNMRETFARVLSTGESDKYETGYRDKEGNDFFFEAHVGPIWDSGQIVGFITRTTDITNRKKAELKLKESEEMYRNLFNSTPYAIWLVDLRGKILDCNETMNNFMSVFKHTDLIGKPFREVLKMFAREGDPRFENLEKLMKDRFKILLKKGYLKPIEFEIFRGDGKTFWITLESSFVNIDKKRLIQTFIKDISEKKLAEIELEDLRKDLETRVKERTIKLENSEKKYRKAYNRANCFKGLFTHDISNMFHTIGNSIELCDTLLKEGVKNKDMIDYFDVIEQQITRGKKLIKNIRNLSEIEESEMPLVPTEVFDKLRNAIQFVKVNFQKREITFKIVSDLDEIYVLSNDLLLDVFENILINSVHYNKNEPIKIEINISRLIENEKPYIKLEFKDNGIGINDNRKSLIFMENYKKRTGSKGMGLGLSLVAKLLDLCEGKIWVEDRVKGDYTQGSNFIILIPEVE